MQIGFGRLLTIVFIVLTLMGTITWSWPWVLSPLWIARPLWIASDPLLIAVVLLVVLALAVVALSR